VRLGTNQREVLRNLARRNGGKWWRGCGWIWRTEAITRDALRMLCEKGLARRSAPAKFEITEAGKTAAGSL
jgi:hypothetical protein